MISQPSQSQPFPNRWRSPTHDSFSDFLGPPTPLNVEWFRVGLTATPACIDAISSIFSGHWLCCRHLYFLSVMAQTRYFHRHSSLPPQIAKISATAPRPRWPPRLHHRGEIKRNPERSILSIPVLDTSDLLGAIRENWRNTISAQQGSETRRTPASIAAESATKRRMPFYGITWGILREKPAELKCPSKLSKGRRPRILKTRWRISILPLLGPARPGAYRRVSTEGRSPDSRRARSHMALSDLLRKRIVFPEAKHLAKPRID